MDLNSLFGRTDRSVSSDNEKQLENLPGGNEPVPYVPAPTLADVGGGGGVKNTLKAGDAPDVTGGDAAKQSKATADHIHGQWKQKREASEERLHQAIRSAEKNLKINSDMAEQSLNRASQQSGQASAASSALGQRISNALKSKPAIAPAPAKSGGMGMGQ